MADERPDRFPIRLHAEQGWQVFIVEEQEWLNVQNEEEAKAISVSPLLNYDALQCLRTGADFAKELSAAATVLRKYGRHFLAGRFESLAVHRAERHDPSPRSSFVLHIESHLPEAAHVKPNNHRLLSRCDCYLEYVRRSSLAPANEPGRAIEGHSADPYFMVLVVGDLDSNGVCAVPVIAPYIGHDKVRRFLVFIAICDSAHCQESQGCECNRRYRSEIRDQLHF